MDTDTLVERFIEQARDWENLPNGCPVAGGPYQMVHPNLDVRDEARARAKMRSLVNGFTDTIVISKADGAQRGRITVWAPIVPQKMNATVSLTTRTH